MIHRLVLLMVAFATAPALHGQTSDARQEFVRSLTLRADRIIADSTHPSLVWLAQTNPAAGMKAHGLEVGLVGYNGFNHDTAPGASIPHLFEFFNAHPRN